uniref:Palmitoleoyl-protein carboxylesterase NOTUM-like n=1 Tax=Petromyzon marinus TaxID=7757 RepID=A0AAJ7TRB4_PETMA|nr:palmitoleoyl-protein carboxylesterase NOTUM-like [Petromyzon marinus]
MSPPRVWPLLVALAILPGSLPGSPAAPSGPASPWPQPRRTSWRGGPNVAARRHRDQRPPRGHGQHGPSGGEDMQALNRAGGPGGAVGTGGPGGVRMDPWNHHHQQQQQHNQQQHNQQQQHHQQRPLKLPGGMAQHSRQAASGVKVASAAAAAQVMKSPPAGKASEREPREPAAEWLSAQLGSLARSLHACGSSGGGSSGGGGGGAAERGADALRLRFLGSGREVTCNDGSPAGYYIRKSEGSKRWLIFLEGGWYCHSRESCDARFASLHHLMSSAEWPHTRTGNGILSPRPEENPHWWNANTVFVPYCSSDVWSGNAPRSSRGGYAFLGARILREVVVELVRHGMGHARTIMLAGSSAGGTGVLLHLDSLAAQLRALGVPAQLRGLADSGWFVERRGGGAAPGCGGGIRPGADCGAGAPAHSMQHAVRFWNGSVPERCRLHLPPGEEWKCFFGFITFQTLATPVFVAQWLFDEAQLTADNVQLLGPTRGGDQLPYLRELGQELRATLHPLPAVFSPACLAHTLITSSGWADVQVKGLTLPRALQCWEQSLQHAASRNGTKHQQQQQQPAPQGALAERSPPAVGSGVSGEGGSSGGSSGGRWAAAAAAAAPAPCAFRAVDSCPWPHCNPSCPALRDALTGQEVSAIAFLTQLGFDVRSMASQLGMDPDTLLNVLSDGT